MPSAVPPLILALLFAVGLFALGRRSEVANYLFKRFLLACVTLLLVSFLVFAMMEVVPGDCATRMIAFKNTQGENITQAEIEAERIARGLDGNFFQRYFNWAWGVAWRADLGFSCEKRTSVNIVLGGRFWVSLALCALGLAFAYLLAIPLGIFSAAAIQWPWLDRNPRRTHVQRATNTLGFFLGRLGEVALRIVSYLGLALPNFLIALGIIVFYVTSGLDAPIGLFADGMEDADWFNDQGFNTDKLWALLQRVWLPIFVLGWSATALQLQTVRALVMDENNKLYVTAAKARGQSGMGLWMNYPVRHSIGPVVNSVGFDFTRIFNDLPIVAVILLLTDAGQLLLEALAFTNDQQLAAGILMLITLTIITLNYFTDALLALTDPRVRSSVLE